MAVVVVESPAKAKTINAYLGKDHTVLASYGHVRDLPSKDGSVDPEQGFAMTWEVDGKAQKHVRAIAEAMKDDPKLILATDPDREGEAISWHLLEALRKRRAIKKDTPVERVVFNAITKTAVTEAMKHPRDIDMPLVEAYLARRALDYLVGFTLSPVLWRKLPGAKSAGRVQSVALRLIVEREMEIEAFRSREYWSVKALLTTPDGAEFEARLVTLDGRKLDKFDLGDEAAATRAVAAVTAARLTVDTVEAKPATRNPAPPFTTSTLQQEASRKLSMGAQEAMRTAQRLYEAGHITYMRTDGVDMAPEAVQAARATVTARYGAAYLPEKPRIYKTKAKNAQEAHECIRPTRLDAIPGDLRLDKAEARLYELIWKRAVASQMASARFERTTVEIGDGQGQTGLRATGQVVTFDGFLKVYEEGRDDRRDGDDDEDARRLPPVTAGAALGQNAVTPEQHFTQPPPRYTEATIVKRMEELGIGRPSTYASIISTIQDREYVRKDKGRLFPEDKGRLVTAFLMNYFARYVDYDFTGGLEEELDEVSGGRIDWQDVLDRFWRDFKAKVAETEGLRISEVLDKINEFLAPHLFPDPGDGSDPRACPSCEDGRLAMKTARAGGAFIGCSNYPNCRYTRPLGGDADDEAAKLDGTTLGYDPDTGLAVTLRNGRFGPYVQLGEGEGEEKPKRASLPQALKPQDLTLETALGLLSLPRTIGAHPEDGEPVEAGVFRYGPAVRHGKTYANLSDWSDALTVGMNRAVELLAEKKAAPGRGFGQAKPPLKELGEHPEGGPVQVMEGRYGPYIKWGKVNATLPKAADPKAVTLEEAVPLLAEKIAQKGGKKPSRAKAAKSDETAKTPAKSAKGTAKAAPKKSPAKKAAKPAAKKAAGKADGDDTGAASAPRQRTAKG
ncbi:MAG: type I DNA topoisomerase [Paracoccaceae bacterium]